MRSRGLKIAFCLAGALALCLGLCGCFGQETQESVAANVNGTKILEKEVTDYIEGFRKNDASCETDAGWAQYLKNSGYTAESMRDFVIRQVLAPKEIVRQECASRNIIVTDEELDKVIEKEKAYYEERYGADSWDSVLASYGYDAESWRQNEEDRLLEERLMATVISTEPLTDLEYQAYASVHASEYSGKHSYYHTYSSEAECLAGLEKIIGTEAYAAYISTLSVENAATNGAAEKVQTSNLLEGVSVTLEDFQKDSNAIDGGWSSLQSSKDDLAKEYLTALNDLSAGQMSRPIQLSNDTWILIFCDQNFIASNDGSFVDMDSLPADILTQLKSDAAEYSQQSLFEDWLNERMDDSSIVVYSMPDDLPYDVNLAITE